MELLDYAVKLWHHFYMRPLYHPSLKDITVQGILYALSDPVRVAVSGCSGRLLPSFSLQALKIDPIAGIQMRLTNSMNQ